MSAESRGPWVFLSESAKNASESSHQTQVPIFGKPCYADVVCTEAQALKKNQPGVNTWVLHVPCLHILHFSPIPGSQPLLNLFISSFFPEWHGSYLWKLIKLKSFLFSLSLIRQQTFIKHQALTTFYEHCFLDKLPQDFTKNLEDNYVFVTGLSSYTFSVCAAVFSYVLDSCFCRHFKWLFSVLFLMQEQEEDRSLYRFT